MGMGKTISMISLVEKKRELQREKEKKERHEQKRKKTEERTEQRRQRRERNTSHQQVKHEPGQQPQPSISSIPGRVRGRPRKRVKREVEVKRELGEGIQSGSIHNPILLDDEDEQPVAIKKEPTPLRDDPPPDQLTLVVDPPIVKSEPQMTHRPGVFNGQQRARRSAVNTGDKRPDSESESVIEVKPPPKPEPTLVICPKAVLDQWVNELK
jgi:hypothetical protein